MRTPFVQIIALLALGIASRLIPHLPNMTAIGAVALRSRARFGVGGLLIPLAALIVSDVIIGFYDWRLLLSVYASFALVGILGRILLTTNVVKTSLVAASGSLVFFFLTNTVVWAGSTWYPHTIGGLIACLAAGLPFLAFMIAGDVLFATALFSKRLPALMSYTQRFNSPIFSAMLPAWLYTQEAATAAPSGTASTPISSR